jgi:hypothetical protein
MVDRVERKPMPLLDRGCANALGHSIFHWMAAATITGTPKITQRDPQFATRVPLSLLAS